MRDLVGSIRHCSVPLRWPLAHYEAVSLLLINAQKRAIDDHGASRFAADPPNVPFQMMAVYKDFSKTECEKPFVYRQK